MSDGAQQADPEGSATSDWLSDAEDVRTLEEAAEGETPLGGFSDWVLLAGNRHAIAAGLTVAVFLTFSIVVASDLVPLTEPVPSYHALGGLVSGNLTLITVVVSINQLLLSRELKAPAN